MRCPAIHSIVQSKLVVDQQRFKSSANPLLHGSVQFRGNEGGANVDTVSNMWPPNYIEYNVDQLKDIVMQEMMLDRWLTFFKQGWATIMASEAAAREAAGSAAGEAAGCAAGGAAGATDEEEARSSRLYMCV